MKANEETVIAITAEWIKAVTVRLIYRLVACFPLRLIQMSGYLLGKLFWVTNSRISKTTLANIKQCFPALTNQEQENLAKDSLIETGKTILETGACWNWSLDKCRYYIRTITGEDLFADYCADSRGLILLMPHLCTWEILHPVLSKHTIFTAMYKPPKIRPLDNWMQAVRNRSSANVVPANRRGVTELVKTLRVGGCIVILPDQEPERESGDFAPFFGVETLTISLAHGLATKTNAQLLLVYAKRLPDSRGFDVVFRDANAVNTKDLRESLTVMNVLIEGAVRENPAQYQWEYKRFKRRPQGKADFY